MLKYQHAKEQVLEKVNSLSPGSTLPPVRSLIKELGYSQVTLKRAFDELEAEGILTRTKGSGIFVAEQGNNRSCVGVLMPHLVYKAYSYLLAGIQEELTKNKLNLLLLPVHCSNYNTLYKTIKENKLVNLIINSSSMDLSNIDFINFTHKLADDGINIVVIDIPVPGLKANFVGQENTAAFAALTEILMKRKVKDIVVAGKFDSKVYFSRLKGIRDAVNGSAVRLRQIYVNDVSLRQVAAEIADSQADAIILCDAGSSVNLSYELKIILGPEIEKKQIGGIVEQHERLPLEHAITLEKQNIELGKAAVDILLRCKDKSEIRLLPIKIIK